MSSGRLACLLGLCALIFAGSVPAAGDPTRPPGLRAPAGGGAPAARPRWQLNATLISPGRRSAMINGRTVEVGGRVNGAQVIAIQPGMVRLRGRQGEFNIYLHGRVRVHKKPTVKQPS